MSKRFAVKPLIVYLTEGIKSTPCWSSMQRRSERSTRVRTVLSESQLHTLQTCYSANPRPDALMKEQLVEMTGLSPRVIRVWFQNKRCKDKKRGLMMRNTQKHLEGCLVSEQLSTVTLPSCNFNTFIYFHHRAFPYINHCPWQHFICICKFSQWCMSWCGSLKYIVFPKCKKYISLYFWK